MSTRTVSTTDSAWVSTTLGALVEKTGGAIQTGPFGSQLHASDYVLAGTPLVMPVNLGDNFIIERDIARIGPSDVRRLRRHILEEGNIVFSRRGDVGRRSIVRSHEAGWLCGTGCLAIRFGPRRETVNPQFVALYLGSPRVRAWLEDNAVGGTMPNLNTGILASTPIRMPPREHQDVIVAALDDAENQVVILDRLIAKKQAIKQGMMQSLLTGKTRLPGFTGHWAPLHVASRSTLKARIGWQGLTTNEYRSSGDYRLVGGTEFADGRVNWRSTPYVDKWRFDQDLGIQLRRGDVLLTKDGTIGKTAYVDRLPSPATLNSGVFVIRPTRQSYDSRFLYYMLRSRAFDQFLVRLAAGSTISHLYQRDLVGLVLDVPPTLKEQRAISSLLADIDSEIGELRTRIGKAKAIKQGMMQELLTGRTRLPVKEAVS